MPNQSLLARVSIETLEHQLNQMETIDAVAKLHGVSYRTVERAINGKLEAHQCWRRVETFIDGTFNTTLRIPPVIDVEGQAQ